MQSYPSQLGFKQESGRILKLIRRNQGLVAKCWLSGTWLETGGFIGFLETFTSDLTHLILENIIHVIS